jgi:general secretion pathway protein K
MKKPDEKGLATILILMVMAIITAIVIEFAYASYTSTIALSNWRDAQRLSLVAKSAILLKVRELTEQQSRNSFTYPGRMEMPVLNILQDFDGKVLVRIEDENAKFNLNSLVLPNGTTNPQAYETFRRLLRHLNLDEKIADRVADWMDRDAEPRFTDSEEGAKNDYMDSVDELLLMKDIDIQAYEKLLSAVTVYGVYGLSSNLVNINTAPLSVIMALDENMTAELAERIINYRFLQPFKLVSDLVKVAGFEGPLGQSLMGRITVKAAYFRVTAIAEDNGIVRIIECVIVNTGNDFTIRHWQET